MRERVRCKKTLGDWCSNLEVWPQLHGVTPHTHYHIHSTMPNWSSDNLSPSGHCNHAPTCKANMAVWKPSALGE